MPCPGPLSTTRSSSLASSTLGRKAGRFFLRLCMLFTLLFVYETSRQSRTGPLESFGGTMPVYVFRSGSGPGRPRTGYRTERKRAYDVPDTELRFYVSSNSYDGGAVYAVDRWRHAHAVLRPLTAVPEKADSPLSDAAFPKI